MTVEHRLLAIPSTAGTTATRIEVHSGIARHYPRIYGNLVMPVGSTGTQADVGLVIVHPTSNFLGHHLLEPIARAGLPIIGLNTRYVGNDATVIMENAVLDVGAAVRWAREQLGWRKVVLVGFSGGGSLVSYYQSQAEHPTVRSTPAGDPPDLTTADLVPADALVLVAAHAGRSTLLQRWIDPSVTDEGDPDSRDDDLDLYRPDRTVPFDRDWLARYREAQAARMQRIDAWVVAELARLTELGISDRAFVVHRTVADPAMLDLTIDPSERAWGSMYGDPKAANDAPAVLGRLTTLRSWLSSWSPSHSQAEAVPHLQKVSVPVSVVHLTGDEAARPIDAHTLFDAIPPGLGTLIPMHGMNHYFLNQPNAADETVAAMRDWLGEAGLVDA